MSEHEAAAARAFARILHPTDLGAGSERAFAHGLRLALAAKGRFHVVHAEPDAAEDPHWEAFPGVRGTLVRWGLLEPDTPAAAVGERLGVHVRKVDLPARDPVRGVLRFLEDHPADLIVLATRAREGLPRWLGGSVAEPLARAARLPALFVPHGSRGFVDPERGEARLRTVLVPVDRSPDPGSALALALALVELLEAPASLHLLHVGPADDAPAPAFEPRHEGRLRRLTRSGPVVDAVVDAARELDADLVVMATHGHDGILDAFRGSTTEQVLRRVGRALLAVPA